MLEPLDFVDKTDKDFAAFLADKPKPLGIILNDCILRRLGNGPSLTRLKTFAGIPTAGFSTFGELLGININQTGFPKDLAEIATSLRIEAGREFSAQALLDAVLAKAGGGYLHDAIMALGLVSLRMAHPECLHVHA